MFMYGRRMKRRQLKTPAMLRRRLQARPTPLLGLIYCRRLSMTGSPIGRTAAYHVGTRRRHAFLLQSMSKQLRAKKAKHVCPSTVGA